MKLVESSKHGMSIMFSHYYSSLMHSGTDFLMKPVFLHGVVEVGHVWLELPQAHVHLFDQILFGIVTHLFSRL